MSRIAMIAIQMVLVCFIWEAAEAKLKICDGSKIRSALVSVCDFKRRDIHPHHKFINSLVRYQNNVLDVEPIVMVKLSRSFRRQHPLSNKVKRHREYALHRKCCINGCTRDDFVGIC